MSRLHPPFLASVSPGPGSEVRNGIGWTSLEKTARSGMCWFRGALGGESVLVALSAAGDWSGEDRSSQRGRSSRFPRVLVHMRMGMAQLSGRILVSGVGRCLSGCGGLSHP